MNTASATRGFLDLRISDLTLAEAVAAIVTMSRGARFSYVVTPNVDHVVMLHRASEATDAFRRAYACASLILCDSRILARLARLSGLRLSVVPGSDLTAALFRTGAFARRSVAIVGGDTRLPARLAMLYPDVRYAQHCPPMGVLRDPAAMEAIVAFVEHQQADVILFAIGAPQSEIAARLCSISSRTRGVALCVGASLEFLTNDKRRAPHWIQRLGMEWAFRLASEPRRLWRRYLVEGPRIFIIWWQWQRTRR